REMNMTIEKYGYARVSSRDQDLSIQEAILKAAGCRIIRMEKASGTSRKGRPELELLLEFMREGDELVVTRIDRLARSISDLQDIVRTLKTRGVILRVTEQPIDTSTVPANVFSTCSASLPSLKPTCARSASSKASPRQKLPVSTRAASARSRSTRSNSSRKLAGRSPRSQRRSTYPGRRSITS